MAYAEGLFQFADNGEPADIKCWQRITPYHPSCHGHQRSWHVSEGTILLFQNIEF